MTRSKEKGESEITAEVKKRAARTGEDVCDILREMMREAHKAKDARRQRKIRKAEKFLDCHNRRERRSRR